MNYRQAKKGCMKHGSYHISKKENKETWEILKCIYPQEKRGKKTVLIINRKEK